MKLVQILVFVCAGCALAPSAPTAAGPTPAGGIPLPRPRGALEFPTDAREIGLDWLVTQLAHLTGQELVMTLEAQKVLENSKEPLESTAPVPADEVYAFVEAILFQNQFVIAPAKGGSRPMLGIYGSMPGRVPVSTFATYLTVGREDLEELASHPALLVQILVDTPHIDARQVQTQLRAITADASNLQQVVPVGDSSLLLQGPAQRIASLARLLFAADEHAGQRRAPEPPPAQSEGAQPAEPAQSPGR